jgi:hypothetical protein
LKEKKLERIIGATKAAKSSPSPLVDRRQRRVIKDSDDEEIVCGGKPPTDVNDENKCLDDGDSSEDDNDSLEYIVRSPLRDETGAQVVQMIDDSDDEEELAKGKPRMDVKDERKIALNGGDSGEDDDERLAYIVQSPLRDKETGAQVSQKIDGSTNFNAIDVVDDQDDGHQREYDSSRGFEFVVTRRTFRTLRSKRFGSEWVRWWLSDEIMNFMALLITELAQSLGHLVSFIPSWSFNLVVNEYDCVRRGKRIDSLLKSSRSINGCSLYSLEVVFLVVNENSNHWICIEVYLPGKKIVVHDSLPKHKSYYETIVSVVVNIFETEAKFIGKCFPQTQWTYDVGNMMRQQNDNNDCGIEVIYLMEQIALRLPESIRSSRKFTLIFFSYFFLSSLLYPFLSLTSFSFLLVLSFNSLSVNPFPFNLIHDTFLPSLLFLFPFLSFPFTNSPLFSFLPFPLFFFLLFPLFFFLPFPLFFFFPFPSFHYFCSFCLLFFLALFILVQLSSYIFRFPFAFFSFFFLSPAFFFISLPFFLMSYLSFLSLSPFCPFL